MSRYTDCNVKFYFAMFDVGHLIRGTPPPHQLGHNMTAVGACLCVRKFSRASEEQRGDTEPEK